VRVEREPHGRQLELDAEVQRVRVEEAVLGRDHAPVGVLEARERLRADDLAAREVHDRLQRDLEALAADQAPDAARELLPARTAGPGQLLLARSPLALGLEVGLDLALELAQLVREPDEAHHQADGGDRELARAQREAGPPGVGVGLRRERVRERVARGERERRDHAHRAPHRRAVLLAPPGDRRARLDEHDRRHEQLEQGRVAVVEGDEVAERRVDHGGPGEQQRRRRDQRGQAFARRRHARHGEHRGRGQPGVPDEVARGAGVGGLRDHAAVGEDRGGGEDRQQQPGARDRGAGGHPAQLRVPDRS
jgi:hypothetical protein